MRGLGPGAKLGRLASNYLANIVTGLDAAKYEGLVFVSGCCSLPAGLCKLPAADPRLGLYIWMVCEWHECFTPEESAKMLSLCVEPQHVGLKIPWMSGCTWRCFNAMDGC